MSANIVTMDLSDPSSYKNALETSSPDVVINAAVADMKLCKEDEPLANLINAPAPFFTALASLPKRPLLVQFSTGDYFLSIPFKGNPNPNPNPDP